MKATNRGKTSIIMKPNGVKLGLIRQIIARFQIKGFQLCGIKLN